MTKVEKIHKEFGEALDSSKIEVGDISVLEDVNTSMERLSSLGLHNTKTYQKFNNHYSGRVGLIRSNKLISELQRLETNYPNYRLIGLKKIIEICNKYNLYLSKITNFTGSIPSKNLSEIEKHREVLSQSNKDCANNTYYTTLSLEQLLTGQFQGSCKPQYFIAAPKKDFIKGLVEIGRTLHDDIKKPKFSLGLHIDLSLPVLDPVVLCPMKVDNAIIFQIVTAWGPEADDDYIRKNVIITPTSSN